MMLRRVLSFHYTLTDTSGHEIDSSQGKAPLPVLEGVGQIIPALEEALFKMSTGDKGRVEIAASDAYGQVDDSLFMKIPKSQFPKETEVAEGMQFKQDESPESPVFTVMKVEGEEVHLDGNHPLAGVDLVFDVEVTEIREATPEEQAQSNGHGNGCGTEGCCD